MRTCNVNLKMNATVARCFASKQNIMTCHNMSQTCHMRHICMSGNQIIKKLFCSQNNLLYATFLSHPIKMGCVNTKSQCLIDTTINPIWCSHSVHPGTKSFTICSLKSKENIIFAHNFISEQKTNQASHCFEFHLCIFSLV